MATFNMITTLLFVSTVALSCPATKIINTSKYPWTSEDEQNLKRATRRCGEIYGESGSCLTVFTKKDERAYTAACGAKR